MDSLVSVLIVAVSVLATGGMTLLGFILRALREDVRLMRAEISHVMVRLTEVSNTVQFLMGTLHTRKEP